MLAGHSSSLQHRPTCKNPYRSPSYYYLAIINKYDNNQRLRKNRATQRQPIKQFLYQFIYTTVHDDISMSIRCKNQILISSST